jgi:hypothetical protein
VSTNEPSLPLWFKITYTAFVAVLVPVYVIEYGWANFLWFSNLALLVGVPAAWFEERRLASMLLIAVALPELVWLLDFLIGLIRGGDAAFGLAAYMFDAELPLVTRLLSLYHVPLPFVLFWMTWRLRYDSRAWRHWIAVGWVVLVLSFVLTTPEENINWVYGAARAAQDGLPAWLWFVIVTAAFTLVWWFTHRLLYSLFGRFARLA